MNQEQKRLVQTSFAQVAEIADTAAALFYGRLFELDPQLRPLFSDDLTGQGRKLMQMLAVAVGSLDRLETLRPELQQLGARHVAYGVEPHHYQTAGAALLWTLEQGLGESFTPETCEAWTTLYTLIDQMMRQAATAAAVA